MSIKYLKKEIDMQNQVAKEFIFSAVRGLRHQPEKRTILIKESDLLKSNLERLKRFSSDFSSIDTDKILTAFNIESISHRSLTFSNNFDLAIYELLETYEFISWVKWSDSNWSKAWESLKSSIMAENKNDEQRTQELIGWLKEAYKEVFEAFEVHQNLTEIEYRNLARNKQGKLELIF